MAPKRLKEKLAIDTGESSNPYLHQRNEHIRENNMKLYSLGLPSMLLPVGGMINFPKKKYTASHPNDTPAENLRGQMIFFP
jgi:hypothetical protein